MVSTYTSYQLIARDIDRSLTQVKHQPTVERETTYYLENISKVKTIDEFVSDSRLFNYAMKAHGLGDMAYAKAFMVKAMEEGVRDPDSFANQLTDQRYAEFVKSYNFEAFGETATTYSPAQQGTTTRYQLQAATAGVSPDDPLLQAQTEYYLENIKDVSSIDEFLKDDTLYSYAVKAFGLTDRLDDKDFMRRILEGGVGDSDSLANKQSNTAYKDFAATFNFAEHGEQATNFRLAQEDSVAKYARQTLEEDAGAQNEGVRLALYFQRKAPDIDNAFDLLADTALAKVARTVLGLPDSIATSDVDKQAALLSDRIDFEDLKDPDALNAFLTRFTSLWELNNGEATSKFSPAVLLSQPVEFGISTDILLTLARIGR